MNQIGLSRRSFLGLGAVAAISAGTASALAGCAPNKPTDAATESGNQSTSKTTKTDAPNLNPQDMSFLNEESDCSALFEPLQIGPLTLPNRIIKPAAGSYSIDAGINDQAIGFYERLATGGAGFIWHESLSFYPYTAADMKPLIDRVHEKGCLIGLQDYLSWERASTSKHLISPLEMDMPEFRHTKMSIEEIHAAQEELVARARFAQEAGFDAFELNCSCDHGLDTFLSRFWNDRDDEYGPQSFENRARIVTEIVSRIKDECGADFPVQVMFNGIEENVEQLGDSSLCITPEEAIELAKLFEAAGVDSLQVRSATFGNHCAGFMPDLMHFCEHGNTGLGTIANYDRHFEGIVNGSRDGVAALAEVAALVKQSVSIPVGFVGGIDPRLAPAFTNNLIAQGHVDFIMVNRPLLADPDLPNKLKEGKRESVRPCNRCINCFKAVADMWGIGYCRVNPSYIRGGTEEMPEGATPLPTETPKSVMVVGGGPAGMEAAAVAAQRGHTVSLYEAKSSLGGRLSFAAAVKGAHERLDDYRAYLAHQLEESGVEVHLDTTVDAALVQEASPDVLLVATGGVTHHSAIPGADGEGVYGLDDVATAEVGEHVCIIGGNIIAVDFAMKLTGEGKNVTILSDRPHADIAIEQASWPRLVMKAWFTAKGGHIFGSAEVQSVSSSTVTFITETGIEKTLECNTVFVLEDLDPNTALADEVQDITEVKLVGDSAKPYNILEAIRDANLTARSL